MVWLTEWVTLLRRVYFISCVGLNLTSTKMPKVEVGIGSETSGFNSDTLFLPDTATFYPFKDTSTCHLF